MKLDVHEVRHAFEDKVVQVHICGQELEALPTERFEEWGSFLPFGCLVLMVIEIIVNFSLEEEIDVFFQRKEPVPSTPAHTFLSLPQHGAYRLLQHTSS